ncbi:hypothetical protein [Paracoccus sp. SCSIO 75233]|uniref:hypothetical protein n=1 Tax=Paracoccus sp. SCSIO 75233 TaxID=3017782 RepID=UPI0022EFF94E|nr:hypothetical protein [Paracoccus sp. SCSIO 75233]WBU51968.1 hypothetical protein PAF12_08930 [Paracoccus sp. SCSIO 75233]
MEVSREIADAVDRVVRERIGRKVHEVSIDAVRASDGEVTIFVTVVMEREATAADFAGKFFGLTGRVRDALGEDMRDVFPVIRPVEAHA